MSDIEQKCKVALQALSDWAVTYAPDMCCAKTVREARQRVLEHGTLAYIANATDQLHAVILSLSEADKREREARAKALEEAAAYHEYRADNHAAAHRHVVSDFHELMEKTHRDAAADIRALQSEER